MSNKVFYYELQLLDHLDETLHITIEANKSVTRSSAINVAFSNHKVAPNQVMSFQKDLLQSSSIFLDYGIIEKRTPRDRTPDEKRIVKFTVSSGSLRSGTSYFLIIWMSHDEEDDVSRRSDLDIDLMIVSWFSDCFYWADESQIWSRNGIEASPKSTKEQTICLTNHLSMFGSSYRPIRFIESKEELYEKKIFADYILVNKLKILKTSLSDL